MSLKAVAAAVTAGTLFGFALNKGAVFSPETIYAQMKMQHFTMMKMFLSAAGTSSIILGVGAYLFPARYREVRDKRGQRSQAVSVIGGLLLGMGMTLSGSCPGTVLVQFGSGVNTAIFVLVGGYAGALAYSYCDSYVKKLFPPSTEAVDKFVDTKFRASPVLLSIAFGVAMISVASLIEHFIDWRSDLGLPASVSNFPSLESPAWDPRVAGMIVAVTQIPTFLLARSVIGSSSAYVTILANACSVVNPEMVKRNAYLSSMQTGIGNYGQVIYAGASIFGAFLSAYSSHTFGTVEGFSPLQSFLGGFLLLFGARLSGGCTSGHGISGMSLLSVNSIVTVVAMFAGAIGLASLM